MKPEQRKTEERDQTSPDMSRRKFGKLALAAAAAIAAFETGSAKASPLEKRKQRIENHPSYQESFENLEDPNNFKEHLKDGEYIVDNEIYKEYSKIIDNRDLPEWAHNPIASYHKYNFLDTPKEKQEFRSKLEVKGLEREEIQFYMLLFSSRDIIIISEKTFQDTEHFPKILAHERMHQELYDLEKEDRGMFLKMKAVAEEITSRKRPFDLAGKEIQMPFIQENYRQISERSPGYTAGMFNIAIEDNWQEFYTYMAQGYLEQFVEDTLKEEYPEVHEKFTELKEKCKLIQEEN